jgi:hypothetical protein
VHSIEEFWAINVKQSSFEIYEQAMRVSTAPDAETQCSDALRELVEQRPVKLQVRNTLRCKIAQRSGSHRFGHVLDG